MTDRPLAASVAPSTPTAANRVGRRAAAGLALAATVTLTGAMSATATSAVRPGADRSFAGWPGAGDASAAPVAFAGRIGTSADDAVTVALGGDRSVAIDAGAWAPYRLQRADGTWTEPRELDGELHLRFARFDPLVAVPRPAGDVAAAADGGRAGRAGGAPDAPNAPADPAGPITFDPDSGLPLVPDVLASSGDARLRIVQLRTQWVAGYREVLEAAGAEVHQHLPATARLIRAGDAAAEAIAALPFVRWVGPYHPVYRADERMLAALTPDGFDLPAARYLVRLVDPAADRPAFAAAVEAIGGTVDRLNGGALISEVTLDAAQLAAVLRMDTVLFVDPWSPYEPDIDLAREIGGAIELETVHGFDGAGVRGEVLDTGFNVGHVDFASRPLIIHGQIDNNSHGSSCAGIIFGDGAGQTSKRGLLPAGQGIVADYSYTGISGPSRYEHTAELVTSEYEAVFQTNSFGSSQTTEYTNASAEMDAMIFDFDLSILNSQSNTGSQTSRPQAWAKNVISVGGTDHFGTLSKADDAWGGASFGPAADGRIKPDLLHFYDGIGTVTCCGPTDYTNNFGGTSGATPIVAGYVGLFYEMWSEGIFGNEVDPSGSVFDNRCAQTTAKAAVINAARPYDWTAGGPNGTLDRFKQGWGMPSAIDLFEQRASTSIIDESVVLPNLGGHVVTAEVMAGEPELRITLTWADLPGTTSSNVHRINDLDLRVTGPDGAIYHGNHGLTEGLWSLPGGARDDLNTVENVFVQQPAAGTWTIEVIATELNEDGHLETPGLDTDFALVSRGVVVTPPPLVMQLTSGIPDLLPPGEPFVATVRITDGTEALDADSALVAVRAAGDADFSVFDLEPVDGEPGSFSALLPDLGCDTVEFYVEAMSVEGTVVRRPSSAPDAVYSYPIGVVGPVLVDDGESAAGWSLGGGATAGLWEQGVPNGGFPPVDADGSGACWQTGIAIGDEVDGGSTVLFSPVYDLSAVASPVFTYQRYFLEFGQGPDTLTVAVTNDGVVWHDIETVSSLAPEWVTVEFDLESYAAPSSTVQLRFTVTDGGPESTVEAGVDAITVVGGTCDAQPADVNGDGVVDFFDLLTVLGSYGACVGTCPADVDGNGVVDFFDVLTVLGNWS